MQTNDLILAEEFCSRYNIGLSFIHSLGQCGLIEFTSIEEAYYIPHLQLKKLEQLTRLHCDLGINVEGIDAVSQLLEKIKDMQSEITLLRNRLSIYEKAG